MASAWFGSPMTLCQSATGSWLAIRWRSVRYVSMTFSE